MTPSATGENGREARRPPWSGGVFPGAGHWIVVSVVCALASPVLGQGRGSRDYGPIVLGDWLFYPSLMAGGIYNDNVFSSAQNKVGRLGTTFNGSGYLSRVDGVSQSQVYLTARADIYPSETNANAFTGAFGATHAREFGQDLLFNAGVEVARIQNSLQAPILTAANTFDLSSTAYSQFQTQASLRKTFNRLYVEGGGSFVAQVYDETNQLGGSSNGWSARARVRAGYEVGPIGSIYVEPSVNWQRYETSFNDTDGYRVVAGFSFPRLSLFTGDVYAGYMWQDYPNAGGFSKGAPTFGGSVSWLPTEDIVVTLAASQSYGIGAPTLGTSYSILGFIPGATPASDPLASTSPQPVATPAAAANAQATQVSNSLISSTSGIQVSQQLFASSGSTTKSTVVSVGGRYLATQAMTVGATVSYQNQTVTGAITNQSDSDLYLVRANVDYSLTANWGLSATYSFARVLYDTPGLSYSQNVVTLGVSGRL